MEGNERTNGLEFKQHHKTSTQLSIKERKKRSKSSKRKDGPASSDIRVHAMFSILYPLLS